MRSVNAAGIEIIKRSEDCVLHAYQDVVGVWTIGYGDTGNVEPGDTITQAEAERRLADRLSREFVPGVLAALGEAPTSDNQLAAMVSLAYNIGVGGFQKSTVARMHRAGDRSAAAEAFAMWNKAGGRILGALTRRRAEEAALYLRPDDHAAALVEQAVTSIQPPAAPVVDLVRAAAAVKAIQAVLQLYGNPTLAVDGDWGKQTEAALDVLLKSLGLESC